MQTILSGKTKQVKISSDGAFVIIGEKINPTGRKKLAAALQEGDFKYVRELANRQLEAGADVLDVNVGVPGMDEVALLPRVVQMLAAEYDVPLCLDSANPDALAAALAVAPGKSLVNSISGEEFRLDAILPVVKAYGAAVIGLAMDSTDVPKDPQKRLAIVAKILDRAAKAGIPPEDVVIDPLVMTVGADHNAASVTLQTIELVRREFGTNINLGASNVSFGLPDRDTVNMAFMAVAMHAGATCAITDPVKMTGTIRATDLLLGRDAYGKRYVRYCRSRPKETT
jgi:5-methyltetrahydrofolate--homocysteine methyltransferase